MRGKKVAVLLTLCLMLICSTGLIYADISIDAGDVARPPGEDGTQAIIPSASVSMVRTAEKTARVTITCGCDEIADTIEAELQVQRLDTETGKYYDYTADPYYRYAYDSNTLTSVHSLTVEHTGTYRVKVNFTAYFDGITYSVGPAYSQAVAL
ncbi:MAG: hypothetical protein E7224_06960 [Clostridiales bacterium]|nr:hypothetical protein [Clostridiales bacterium]